MLASFPIALPSWAAPRYRVITGSACGAVQLCLEQNVTEAQHEIALMKRVGQGDARAYRELSERHLRSIVAYADRLLGQPAEAEDVAQETFLRLWKDAGRWQPRARLSTWLHRMAHNLCIDRLRKRRETSPEHLDRQSAGDRPSTLLARKQIAQQVDAALHGLPERQRAAIQLVHYQGLTNIETAEVLDVGVEAVESLLSRARKTLRERLADLQDSQQPEGQ